MTEDTCSARSVVHGTDRKMWTLLFVAWLTALFSTLGALFIGEVLGHTPCQLCWYQRIAMFPLALILGIACLRNDYDVRRYVLPIAVLGFGLALWHNLLYFGVIPESITPCDRTLSCSGDGMVIFNWAPIPILSMAAFGLILALTFLAKPRNQQ